MSIYLITNNFFSLNKLLVFNDLFAFISFAIIIELFDLKSKYFRYLMSVSIYVITK